MLKHIQTDDRDLNLQTDFIDQELTKLQTAPLAGGKFLTVTSSGVPTNSLTLTTGQANLFTHGLGYIPKLVLPMAPNVSATIWVNTATTTSTVIDLRCSATCTTKVWVN